MYCIYIYICLYVIVCNYIERERERERERGRVHNAKQGQHRFRFRLERWVCPKGARPGCNRHSKDPRPRQVVRNPNTIGYPLIKTKVAIENGHL